MTAAALSRGSLIPVRAIGTARLTSGLDRVPVVTHDHHLFLHGPITWLSLDELVDRASAVRLLGRGGGAFPVATKLAALRGARRPAVVVNVSESEPASAKDRLLATRLPHLVLDGALLVAAALKTTTVELAVHSRQTVAALEGAIAERSDARRVKVVRLSGGFVAGEARAVLEGLSGRTPIPPGRKTLPTVSGLRGAPTFISNAETFAQLALLARLGVAGFAEVGTRHEPGTALMTIGGAVGRPGVVEIPLGIGLDRVLTDAGVSAPAYLVVGGYHGSWITPRAGLTLSLAGLASVGARFGAGVLLVIDQNSCALAELAQVTAWLARESAGQCGPCRFGLPAIADDVVRLVAGDTSRARSIEGRMRVVSGRGACAHPDGTVAFVRSALTVLTDEVRRHSGRRGCGRRLLGQLPLPSG